MSGSETSFHYFCSTSQIKNTIIKKEAEAPEADAAKPAEAEDVTDKADAEEAEVVEEAPAKDNK